MSIYIRESWVNATEHYRQGDSDVYESCYDTPGELYRACVKEHGRCTGKMYIDKLDGRTLHIGWVFVKREHYEDTHEPYLLETWVSMHTAPPTHTTEYHYYADA